ncbi:MAG: radical SAM protein [Oscillospiraceae bacterium]|nr:radical SAM protein [Oscillospiraceae bacterium]
MNAMNFNNDKQNNPIISLCCENIPNIPQISFEGTAEEILYKFVNKCAKVDSECRNIQNNSKRIFTKGCVNCSQFQPRTYNNDRLIHYINLSAYPSPCQCRCIYCEVQKNEPDITESVKLFDNIIAVLELALEQGLIAPDARWQISSGEIAIHPYRDRLMKILKGRNAIFYTNCMKFDEDVAQNLHDNPNSAINLSIDAGTPETWHKVKGFDNFDKITENLSRYFVNTTRPGQISLKYIIMPGINDTYEDFTSVVEIMKVLNVKHLTISRDIRNKYSMSEQDTIDLTGAAAFLFAILSKNNMTSDMFTYSPEERKLVVEQANEIIAKQLI